MATLSEALDIALNHLRAGRIAAAEEVARRVLAVEPQQPEAWNILGAAANCGGQHEQAIECLRRAVALDDGQVSYHNNLGEAHRALRHFEDAVACYGRAIVIAPHLADVHANLGLALAGLGRTAEAAEAFRKAIALDPGHARAYVNLGNVLLGQRRTREAIEAYRRAVAIKPDYAEAHSNLGVALRRERRLDEAVAAYREAARLAPDSAVVLTNLGVTMLELGFADEALAYCRQAVELRPDLAVVQNNLASLLRDLGRLEEAAAGCQRALQIDPDFAEACNTLGCTLRDLGRTDEAVAWFEKGISLQPGLAEIPNNLGNLWKDEGRLAEAVGCYEQALRQNPDYAEAYNNLGLVYKDQGRLTEAVEAHGRALRIRPDLADAHSNLIYALHFCCDAGPRLAEELDRWNRRHAEPLAELIRPHLNDRSPDRRLRIGYVSADFRSHVVALFLLPLLEAHDRAGFEVICYNSTRVADEITERCRQAAHGWRDVVGLSDERLAALIRQDGIDILVDLSLHLAKNRLLVFARKPAPVQVTYLAYCGTTGLKTIDYRLTDPWLDPPDADQSMYAEESVPLPETYWCYRPIGETPPVGQLPAQAAGRVTFGCLNNFCKVTEPTLELWSRLLEAAPQAKLLLHAHAGDHRQRVREFLAARGVAPQRLEFVANLPTGAYFRLYDRIDVGLDPFPYGGGTTTCDALWMGVPVVSLKGQTAVGRAGYSILSNVGLAELVADSSADYVRIALELAGDPPRLAGLRAGMRQRMQASPLMDAPRFARNVEAAYRQMWRRWCAREEA